MRYFLLILTLCFFNRSSVNAQKIVPEIGFDNLYSVRSTRSDSFSNGDLKLNNFPVVCGVYYKLNDKTVVGFKSSFANILNKSNSKTIKADGSFGNYYVRYEFYNTIFLEPKVIEKVTDFGFLKIFASFSLPFRYQYNNRETILYIEPNYTETRSAKPPDLYVYGLASGLHIGYPIAKKLLFNFNLNGGIYHSNNQGVFRSASFNSLGQSAVNKIDARKYNFTFTDYTYGVSLFYNL